MDSIFNSLEEMGCVIKENEPMSLHTSFKIGGNAKYFIEANDTQSLRETLKICSSNKIPVFIIGNGSNLLVSDYGIDGAVVKLAEDFIKIELMDETTIRCGAGAQLSKLALFALENELTGLEFAWGIPGSAGGAAFMNAGAYGGEMKDVLVSCTHIDEDGKIGEYTGDDLDLGYRHSVYSSSNSIITSLVLKLKKGERSEIKAKMDDFMNRRKTKQPLEYPSAGSVFKRPEGYFAGALIEECSLKGVSVGGAQVSEKHAGFIINTGGAKCADVVALVEKIQQKVLETKCIKLECEIKKIG